MTATVIEISSHPRFKPSTTVETPAAPPAKIHLTREEAIKRIKVALEKRSGKRWSVTGGRGTAWGWLRIDAPPAERTWSHKKRDEALPGNPEDYVEYDTGKPASHMSPARRVELAKLLGKDTVHIQGESIPSGGDYWDEYVQRAETGTTTVHGTPYWD